VQPGGLDPEREPTPQPRRVPSSPGRNVAAGAAAAGGAGASGAANAPLLPSAPGSAPSSATAAAHASAPPSDLLLQRLRAVPGALALPELAAFDARDDAHLDAAACVLLQHFHRSNEAEALSLLFELTHERLLAIAGLVTARLALAIDPQDLVAGFLARLFTDVRRPQPVVRRFLGMAYIAMRNDALNQLRHETRSLRRMLQYQARQPLPPDPAQLADEHEQAQVVARAGLFLLVVVAECFHDLPERARRLLLLREVEGLSYQEVALALGLPIGHVGIALRRARRRLERLIARALAAGSGGEP